MIDVETIIVGGGPAGSSCAWQLRKLGRECLILERQLLPKFKLCAGWITPKVLRDLEIAPGDYPHGLVPLERLRLHWGRGPAALTMRTLQYSIRRLEFDNWLLARAGVPVERHGASVIREEGGRYVVDGEFRGRYLVGAGGTGCPVRRALFGPQRGSLVLTQELEFPAKARQSACVLFYPFAGLAGYGWCVPKAGAVNIGFGGAAGQFRRNVKSYWGDFVAMLLKRGLLEAPPPVPPSSHPYYVGDRRQPLRRGNAFIVGDAAGLATADLGEGIGPAVESGLLAAQQIAGLSRYEARAITPRTMEGVAGRALAQVVARAGAKRPKNP